MMFSNIAGYLQHKYANDFGNYFSKWLESDDPRAGMLSDILNKSKTQLPTALRADKPEEDIVAPPTAAVPPVTVKDVGENLVAPDTKETSGANLQHPDPDVSLNK